MPRVTLALLLPLLLVSQLEQVAQAAGEAAAVGTSRTRSPSTRTGALSSSSSSSSSSRVSGNSSSAVRASSSGSSRNRTSDVKPSTSRSRSSPAAYTSAATGATSSSDGGGGGSITDGIGGTSSRLCADSQFRIGDKRVRSFTDLSRLFAHYTPLPKFGGRHIVAVDVVTPKACGPFLKNTTFYMRVGVRDTKVFKLVFQAQVLRVTKSLFKNPGEPRRILDLGARTGMSTAYLASHFPDAQVIATEPSLPEFSLLRLNTARYKNVRTEYGAVWDSLTTLKLGRGLGTMRHPGTGSSSTSQANLWKRFVVDVMEVAGGGRLGDMVPAITVPDLLHRHGWTDVDLIVADFDGADKVVLGDPGAQAWLKRVRCISLHVTPDQSVAALAKLLGPEFLKAGRVLDQYFWCRAGATAAPVVTKVTGAVPA